MVHNNRVLQNSASPGGGASKRAQAVRPFHVMDLLARARLLEAQGRSIIHLEVGEPDFATAQPIIDAGILALQQEKTHYTPALGLIELRQAIADYYLQEFAVVIEPQRIVVTPGASGALQLALAVLTDPGDRVLLADPGYPCNRNIAHVLGVETDSIPVSSDNGFQLDASLLQQNWAQNTRVAMLASPSNPTGSMLLQSQMMELFDAVEDKGGRLIVDEIYQGLVYDTDNTTALAISDRIFVINSFSKYFGMTGWRLGWMVVPDDFVDAVDRIAQNLFLAPSTLSQHAALKAFTAETRDIMQQRVEVFRQRRDYLLPALSDLGFNIVLKPQGAFYIYADCSEITNDSFYWCQQLLEKQGVAVTPGIDFGDFNASTHVRFAYTRPVEELQQAVQRISEFINSENQQKRS